MFNFNWNDIINIFILLQVNFGDVKIPRGFDYPRPQKLDALSGIHGVSSDPVVIVDAQTLLIPSFSYDGEAPGKITYNNSRARQTVAMNWNKTQIVSTSLTLLSEQTSVRQKEEEKKAN